ncbi:TPA: hypothetical protein HA251_07765 [Candidatus Woesearchaeota archaeon]|nr:hypothetical protein [Candidatus Woesearchaeota archaeon]
MQLARSALFIIAILSIIIPLTAQPSHGACIEYFYGTGCPHCAITGPQIEALAKEENITIIQHDVYKDRNEALVLDRLLAERGLEQKDRAIPATIIGPTAIIGSKDITARVQQAIAKHPDATCPTIQQESDIEGEQGGRDSEQEFGKQTKEDTSKEDTPATVTTVTLTALISAAFVDSINPCAIAVIIILLGGLLAAGDKRKALLSGLAFTTSIYLSYLLFGLGLLSAIQLSGLAGIVAKIVGIGAIIIGLLNIKDYLWYGSGGFVIEIPRAWRPRLKQSLNAITSPAGAFIAGFMVCLFELPCTGGPYLFILGLLADQTTFMSALPLLLLYNLVFVLPLLAITLLLYFGYTTTESANIWKERNIRSLHLIAGIIMTILGIAALLYA